MSQRVAAHEAPPIGQIGRDKSIPQRRMRVGDVDDTHVIAEVSYSSAAEPFQRHRSTRIRIAAWPRRVVVEAVQDPAARWRDPAGLIHRLSDLDVQTLGHVHAGVVTADSRFRQWDFADRGIGRDKLPPWVMARLTRLRLAELGQSRQQPATRPGQNLAHLVTPYVLTDDGRYLVESLRFGEARCRACGCTEDRACPGGCWWVPDPEMGDLCSTCQAILGE
ncbi:MAG: hypothetical protein V7603_5111 [Micromonosporaceae bacterium]